VEGIRRICQNDFLEKIELATQPDAVHLAG
jgi:hypothetical protein